MGIGAVVGKIANGVDSVLDMATGPLDSLCKFLPGPLGDLAKVGLGAATSNPLLVANGATGLIADILGSGPTTEISPKKKNKGGKTRKGYADVKPSSHHKSPGGQDVRYNANSHLDPNYLGYAEALSVLNQNWLTFDTAAGARDQYIRRSDLEAIAHNPKASATLKNAAQFLLQHPEYFNRLEMAAGFGGKDGVISQRDVKAALATAESDLQTYGVGSAPASVSFAAATAKGADSILGDRSMSVEDRISSLLERSLSGVDEELAKLAAEIDAGGSSTELMLRFQRLSEKRSQMFTLLTNFSQQQHEMAKQALQNMGRA